MLAAVKARAGPDRYAILLPLNEFEPLLMLALQQPEPLLRDDGRWGNFESAGFRRALAFYLEMFRQRLGAAADQCRGIQRVGRIRPRLFFVLHLRARGTSANSSAACLPTSRMRG